MRLALSILLLASSAFADIIQPSNRVDWVVGRTVGVQGNYGTRTNLIDVTQAPYGADKTGATNASTAITAAITAAVSNDVVYFPDGVYQVSGIALRKSGITLRGQSTNAILRCTTSQSVIAMGHGTNGSGQWSNIIGAVKGSTNFVFVGTNLPANRVGCIMGLQTENVTDEHFQVINTTHSRRLIEQEVVIHSINGETVNVTAPLVWNFTNNPVIYDNGDLFVGMGIENLTLSYTNRETGDVGSNAYLIYTWSLRDCWIKGCVIEWTRNYAVMAGWSANCEFSSNIVCNAQSAGANHSGLLLKKCSGWLVEDNIFRDGLQPGIEIDSQTVGCAFFGNFFTNNYGNMDFDIHAPHTMMNLFEQNRCSGYWMSDGYFGSASHFTLFRNSIENVGSTQPLRIKRFNSYHQIVGNVLGNSNSTYASEGAVWEFGYPSMGNATYTGDSPPMAWNWPQNPIFTLTNEVTGTNLPGIWTNVTTASRLIFQDSADTNSYWPWSGTIAPFSNGTSSNLLVLTSMTYSNGWTAYAVGTTWAWDQRQLTNRSTFTMHGNWDYFNDAVVWDAGIADHTIPSSMIYTSKPAWWGSLNWPAIGSDLTPMVSLIPAQARYLGIDYSVSAPPATNAVTRRANSVRAVTVRQLPRLFSPPATAVAWWDAAYGVLTASGSAAGNGNRVAQWVDRISGLTLRQGTDGARPYWTNYDNRLPALRFSRDNNTTAEWLSAPLASPWVQTNHVFLAYHRTLGGANMFLVDGTNSSARNAVYVNGDEGYSVFAGDTAYGEVNAARPDTNRWSVLRVVLNGANCEAQTNGAAFNLLSNVSNAGNDDMDGVTIGARYDGASHWRGFIGEVMVLNGPTEPSEVERTWLYFSNKYRGMF